MSSQPALNCLMSAWDTYEESDLSFGIVRLTPERIALMLERIEESTRQRKRDDNFVKSAFWDWGGVTLYRDRDDYYDEMGEEDHPHHGDYLMLEEVREGGSHRLFTESVLLDAPEIRIECEQMFVEDDGIAWQANYRHGQGVIYTSQLPLGDLLVARLYYASEAEWGACFAELARRAPDRAISVLEHGIVFPGAAPIRVTEHVSPDVLASLLKQANTKERERLILVLGESRPKIERKVQRQSMR